MRGLPANQPTGTGRAGVAGAISVFCSVILLAVSGLKADAPAGLPPADELEAFFADELGRMIEQQLFPGAAVVIVQGDRVVLSKGFGLADITTGRPIDPDRTMFRVGSISKLLTAILVLQRVEAGELELDRDINHYLRSIRFDSGDPPTTMRHLLTHTEGLDPAWGIAGAVLDPEERLPLAEFLQQRMPPRILPSGQAYVYHDAGLAIAGLVVQDLAQRDFAEVARRDVFERLGMRYSTFEQPLPAELRGELAIGYRNFGKGFLPSPFEYMQSVPTCAMSTAPGDLAKLMIAMLNDGGGDRPILSRQMLSESQRVHFTYHPSIAGAGLACYERYRNGHRALQHGGLTLGYTNLMILMPERKIGILLCANAHGWDTFEPLVDLFFDRYFPPVAADASADAPATQAAGVASKPSRIVNGRYRYVAHSHSTLAKVSVLAGLTREFTLRTQPDGTLFMGAFGRGGTWVPVETDLYESGDHRLALLGDDVPVSMLAVDLYPFERIGWWEDRRLHYLALAGMMGIFGLTCLAAVVRFARNRRRGDDRPARQRSVQRMTVLGAAVNLAFVATFVGTVAMGDVWGWFHGLPLSARLALVLPQLSVLITAVTLVAWVISLVRDKWRLVPALSQAVVMSAMVLFLLFCVYWNLLAVTPKI